MTGSSKQAQQKWAVAAAFFTNDDAVWLDDFIEDDRYTFYKIVPEEKTTDWHHARARRTNVTGWLAYFSQARKAFRIAPDGIVTCFPQLAMCAALLKRFGRRKPRLIAYNFNLGGLYGGLRGRLARFLAPSVDTFVVHSPEEVESYARYLDLPKERIVFIPLQRGKLHQERAEDTDEPFILAMGSAHRDYETLIKAVEDLQIKTVIVARPDMIEALPTRDHITYLSGLTQDECLDLLAKARLSVTPVSNLETASGQVTFVNAMRLGVPVIATRCPGTDGYIEPDHTGILVEPFDADDMRGAINRLWTDGAERQGLADRAYRAAEDRFSDEAVARRLHALLEDLG